MAMADTEPTPTVAVRELEKRFGTFVAVDRVTFEVQKGKIFGFLGPNGAGKSTTIRMLCGLLAPSGGSGTVVGLDIGTQAQRIKQHIGYMSQRFSLYEDLTVEENLTFFGGIYGLSPQRRRERAGWVMEMADLTDRRTARTGDLPGGWKQRLALGCAILHEPPVLFLDEPTSGVDPINRRRFWDLIYDLAGRGVTVFVSTHYMDEAEYCDRLGLIYRGALIASGTPGTLKSEWMAEAVLEIRCERPQEALLALEHLPELQEVALFGSGLHAVAPDPAAAEAAVRRSLEAGGFALRRIEAIVPSLEDVFVSLIEARDRAAGAQRDVRR